MATPIVEVTAPAPTIKELEQAMIAAHNAGDDNGASILANEINKLQSASKFQFSAKETVKNLPGSIVNEAKNFVGALTQPIETIKGLGNLALGVAEKAIPNTQSHEKYADAMGKYFTNRYGSKDAFLSELQNNPASILSDLSMVATGGASGAAKIASLSKIGAKAVPALEKVAKVGTAIDPLNLAANTTMYGASKVIPKTVAPMMYESAAKWSTKLGPALNNGDDTASGLPLITGLVSIPFMLERKLPNPPVAPAAPLPKPRPPAVERFAPPISPLAPTVPVAAPAPAPAPIKPAPPAPKAPPSKAALNGFFPVAAPPTAPTPAPIIAGTNSCPMLYLSYYVANWF